MAKLLGLDVGAKRIGYAVGDSELAMAFPRGHIERTTLLEDLAALEQLIATEGAGTMIVGEPLGEENEPTARSIEIRSFINELQKRMPQLVVAFIDESFSSKEALAKIPLKRDRKVRGTDDAIAAAIILERYFETR